MLGAASPSVFAQNWMSDARRIAMGGVGGSDNLASRMVDSPQGAHSTIVIPLGLFQVLRDIDIYNPDSDQFDPIRATEYALAPLHYTFNRDGTGTGIEFINGLANKIKWTDVEASRYSLPNILNGTGDFTEITTSAPDVTVEQPIEYVGSTGYHAERWQVTGEIGVRTSSYALDEGRLGKTWIHTGFEYRFGLLEPRAGAYYSRERWTPAAGLGLNFGKFGIDFAAYSNDSNVERDRHPSIALSLRIGSLRRGLTP